MSDDFERLISEAERQPFSGWDFGYLRGRYVEAKPSWDFGREAKRLVETSRSMLDVGTGGGEFLSSLGPLPVICCATEGYPPNSRIALKRLGPIGASVVFTFCDENGVEPQRGALPFREGTFDLVIDRHENFIAPEVKRVLAHGGTFLTQQVGSANNPELRQFFGISVENVQPGAGEWNLSRAIKETESAGLKTVQKREERMVSRFLDVGAVAYYLKAIPWEVPGFEILTHREKLLEMHQLITKKGSFDVTTTRFFVRARKE